MKGEKRSARKCLKSALIEARERLDMRHMTWVDKLRSLTNNTVIYLPLIRPSSAYELMGTEISCSMRWGLQTCVCEGHSHGQFNSLYEILGVVYN